MDATRTRKQPPANPLWLIGFLFFAIGTVFVLLVLDGLESVGVLKGDALLEEDLDDAYLHAADEPEDAVLGTPRAVL